MNYNQPDNPQHLHELILLARELERVDLLFEKLQFEPDAISYLITNKDVFGITDLKTLSHNDLRKLAYYKALVETNKESIISIFIKE